MVVSLSSVDIFFLSRELSLLEGAKLEKVFQQQGDPELLFSFHVPGKGKHFLFLRLPETMVLSSFKPSFPDTPPHFAFMLRKRLSNARLQRISQVGFERIIEMEFSTKHKNFKLIIELFSPGNLLLCDEDYTIREVFSHKIWNENRKLLPKKPYHFPEKQIDPRAFDKDSLSDLILNSDKDSIVKSLAIDCSLGGVYAEHVVSRAGVDKTSHPSSLSFDDISSLLDGLHSLFETSLDPVICDGRPYPFLLSSIPSSDCKKVSSFNEAISQVVLSHLEREDISSQQKEAKRTTSRFEKIISSQQALLSGLQKAVEENQAKGELIYKHYADISKLLSTIKELRTSKSWSEIKELVKENPTIKDIDEHKGLIQLDLD
ncbi:MAG: NFACT family protein [Nanoarchaeota archaeon]